MSNARAAAPAQLLPHLFVGDSTHSCSPRLLHSLGITHIVSVEGVHYEFAGFANLHCPMLDSGNSDLLRVIATVGPFIEEARGSGGRVLVHCYAGINRAPTVCAAYLVAVLRWALRDAAILVKSRRPVACPCRRYLRQLLAIEHAVRAGECSVGSDDELAFLFGATRTLPTLLLRATRDDSAGASTRTRSLSAGGELGCCAPKTLSRRDRDARTEAQVLASESRIC
eukprot:m51a1_g4681 putative dual specificity protein phosphatase 1 (226) ;mRNA; f:164771-165751